MTITKDQTKILTSIEFSRMLEDRTGGNALIHALANCMGLILRFEVKGRVAIGGVEYVREGGPCEGHNRYAADTIDIGEGATKIAECEPDGWVVIGAALRPWCRERDSLSEYRRGGVPFVFKDGEEAARFAERINARSKGDPYKEVKSMTLRDFVEEAQRHAESWRETCR